MTARRTPRSFRCRDQRGDQGKFVAGTAAPDAPLANSVEVGEGLGEFGSCIVRDTSSSQMLQQRSPPASGNGGSGFLVGGELDDRGGRVRLGGLAIARPVDTPRACRSGRRRIGMGGTVGRESIGIRHRASAKPVLTHRPRRSPLICVWLWTMDYSTIDCATHISHSDAPSGSPPGFWCRRSPRE